MFWTWWRTRWAKQQSPSGRRSQPNRFRPQVTRLEDRCVPVSPTDLLTNFAALAATDSGDTPPDTHLAAGPSHVVEVVNTNIAFFDKVTGTKVFQQDLEDFFAPVGAGSFVFDPVVTFDEQASRFVVVALDVDFTNETAHVLFAVSDRADPTAGFTEMHRIDVEQTGADGDDLWGDYPKIGWNADAYVITLNMFDFSNNFDHVSVLTIAKSSVTDVDPSTLTKFQVDPPGDHFTLAAVVMHGSVTGDPMYFVEEAGFANGAEIRVVRMTNVLSDSPTFVEFNLTVSPYEVPPGADQPSGEALDTNDARMLNAEWRANRLVATHAVGIPDDDDVHVRWYEFSTAGASPTLVQQGTLDPGPDIDTYYPSIAIAPNGDIGLTFMQSSPNEFVSMYITAREFDDPLGLLLTPVLVKPGEANYTDAFGSPYRAGDYSGIAVDPIDGTFWAANEYATSVVSSGSCGCNWGTWIVNFGVRIGQIVIIRNLRLNTTQIDEFGQVRLDGSFLDLDSSATSHRVTINWGDGTTDTVIDLGDRVNTFAAAHRYLDDDPSGSSSDQYTITVTVTNSNGVHASADLGIEVINLPPVVFTLEGPLTAKAGKPVTFEAGVTDPSTLDTFLAFWDFGDGTTLSFRPGIDAEAFTPTHTFDNPGSYTVLLAVQDDDGGITTARHQITIEESQPVRLEADPLSPGKTALFIEGTDDHDMIGILLANSSPNEVIVTLNGTRFGTFTPTGHIFVFGFEGDDTVTVSPLIAPPLVLKGGEGNDILRGGQASDILVGGAGNDLLFGGQGRDLLIGGTGSDRLNGDGSRTRGTTDLLISDATVYDNDDTALDQILAEWRSARAYGERVRNLRTGTNGVPQLDASTVLEDGTATDVLIGGGGRDWFFVSPGQDQLVRPAPGEAVN